MQDRAGYVALWRKTLDNEIFRHDHTAWRVFETLLMLADRRTKRWEGGRKQLAEYAGLKEGTTYSALVRLKKAKMITLESNTRYSKIHICKWDDYQVAVNSPVNNRATTGQQQGNTLTRSKKVISKKITTNVVIDNRDPEITQLMQTFETTMGKLQRRPYQITAAAELIREHGLEVTLATLAAVVATRGRPYAPSIGNLEDLRDKWLTIENFFVREQSSKAKVGEIV